MIGRTLIIVPMKDPAHAKSRLADQLNAAQRARLAKLLYRRTLHFLRPVAARSDCDLAVVTGSDQVTAIARDADVPVIAEPNNATLSLAVQAGADWAQVQGYQRLCVIPADLVAPQAADVLRLLTSRAPVTICPATDRGTNALLVCPPRAIRFRYGPQSAQRHLEEAEARGLKAVLMPLDSLSFDIDTSVDLARAALMTGVFA